MICSSWIALKSFVTEEKDKAKLLNCLDSDTLELLDSLPEPDPSQKLGLIPIKSLIADIHYTWFLPFFDKLKDQDKYLFISCLEEKMQNSLMKHYDLTRSLKKLSSFGEKFLLSTLYHQVLKDEKTFLSKEYLPHDPMNCLLKLSREDLLNLVDYLSLHDLSIEMKTIISSSHRKTINDFLKPYQRDYLQKLSQKIEPVSFKPMGLCHWDGNVTDFKKILHQRGLNRLSKALSNSHRSLFLHILHKLDIGRASIVKNLLKEVKNHKAQKVLVEQVREIAEKFQ